MKRRLFGVILTAALFGGLMVMPGIVSAAPKITIEEPLIGTAFEIQSDVKLSGTATPNTDIVINTKEGEYARLKSDKNGKWSYTIPTVSEGSHTVEVKAIQKIDALSEETTSAFVTYVVSPPPPAGVQRLAETGVFTIALIPIGLILSLITIWLYVDYRRHKKPLKSANPKIKYSFWHHLHVVSFPLLKYRLSINIDRRIPDRSVNIRKY